jgi:DNA-binding beta-propeller fold protein YncE
MAESQTPEAVFSNQLLGEFLVQQGLISQEQLEVATERLAGAEAPEAIPVGPAFVPTGDGKGLFAVDARKGTTTATIDLFAGDPGDRSEAPRGWSRYTDGQILILDPRDHQPRRWLPTAHAPRLGLIPTPQGSFLYLGEEPRNEYSPALPNLPSPFLNPAGAGGPLDLFAAPGGEFVVAANRGAGTVHVILTNTLEQRGAVSIRPAGHAKGIGVAISPDARTVYVTDGLTPRLAVLDVASFRVKHQLFPTGPLGSAVVAADGGQLMVTFTKAAHEMGLLIISLPDLRVRHLMNLPGKGEGERPNLPLVNAPDGAGAGTSYLLPYSYETREPHYLLAVDRAKHRVIKSMALKEMPLTAGFNAPAAWCPEPLDLGTVLRDMGLVSDENLRHARGQLAGPAPDLPLSLGTVPINPAILAQLPERLIRDRGVIPLNQLDGQLVVAMANPRDPRARQFVQDLAGELPVRAIPMSAAEFDLFMEDRYPKLMESYFVSQETGVVAPPVAEVVSTIPTTAAPPPPPAALTPEALAEGPRPVRPGQPRQAAAAQPQQPTQLAYDEWGDLPGGRFLLINPLKRQVAELDRTGKASWLYSPEGDTLTRQYSGFVHAGRLPNDNTLVVDVGAHRVVEVTPAKEVVWATAEDARLKGPRHAVRLATGGTLVVDTGNNRLVEIDPAGNPGWTYGEMGCSGNGLFKPSYVNVLGNGRLLVADTGNHRVIEVDPAKGVTWQYGNANNRLGGGQGSGVNQLNEPSAATRLPNGNTLVVDAGNQRVLEIDQLGGVVWTYKGMNVTGGAGVKDPVLAKRVSDGNVLIAGRQGICEVDRDLAIQWEYHLVPTHSPAKNAASAAVRAEAAAPAPQQLRVAAESDVPIQLPNRFLQADRSHNRIWEVDRQKEIVWQYTGMAAAGSDRGQLDRPHYARRLRNGNTLITDTGHHRVLEVTPQGAMVWEFGQFGKLGAGAKQLANPRSAERLTNADTLIADQSNKRVIEVSPAGEIVWSYEGGGTHRLQAPTYATMQPNGHMLVVDWGGHVVYEVTMPGKVVWSYGQFGRSGADAGLLFHPEHAHRLPNGNTMIADTQNHRVLEVTPAGEIVWQCGGDAQHLPRVGRFGIQFLTPIAGWRLPNGHAVIQHAGKGHVVEVDRELNILFQFTP